MDPTTERKGLWLGLPGIFWLTVFFMVPLLFVLVASFLTKGVGVTPTLPLTLEHYERTFGVFGVVVWRSLRIALYTTLWCFLIGLSDGVFYQYAQAPTGQAHFAVFNSFAFLDELSGAHLRLKVDFGS